MKYILLAGVNNSDCVMMTGIFIVLFANGDHNFADHSRHECTSLN